MSYFAVDTISDNELLAHGYQPEEVARLRTVERMALDARERVRQERQDAEKKLFDERSKEISLRYDRLSISIRSNRVLQQFHFRRRNAVWVIIICHD